MTASAPTHPSSHDTRLPRLGLPLRAIFVLAALAVPRVILHDLGVIDEGTVVNALFVFVPPLVWIGVAVFARIRKPFLTFTVVGIVYGIGLMAGHQLLWTSSFPDGTPQLGGNLSELSPVLNDAIVRAFAAVSSIVTGTLVGAVCGLLAAGITWILGARRAMSR